MHALSLATITISGLVWARSVTAQTSYYTTECFIYLEYEVEKSQPDSIFHKNSKEQWLKTLTLQIISLAICSWRC